MTDERDGDWTVEDCLGRSLMWIEERAAVLDRIGPHDRVCEIGTYQGTSCRHWASHRPEAFFLSIDNFSIPPTTDNVALWLRNRLPNMNLFVGTSREALQLLAAHQFDFILVDGGHTQAACADDLEVSRSLLRPGGMLAVHDYEGEEGVTEAIDAFILEHHPVTSALVGTLLFWRR